MSAEFQITEMDRLACLKCASHILRNLDDAEDAVQSALLNVWAHRDKFRGDCPIKAFLLKCVRNQCLQVIRSRHPAYETVEGLPEDHPLFAFAPRINERIDGRDRLERCAKAFTNGHWKRTFYRVFCLTAAGYDAGEMSKTLRVSEQAIKSRVFRMRIILTRAESRGARAGARS